MNSTKIYYFEYFLSVLIDKYDTPNLSSLKVKKLLLFLANTLAVEKEYTLLDIFNNFHARAYGLNEEDIHEAIYSKKGLKYFKIDRFGTKVIKPFEKTVEDDVTRLIDRGVSLLERYGLLSWWAHRLVDLDKCHDSWLKNYNKALSNDKTSWPVCKDDLILENKYFYK